MDRGIANIREEEEGVESSTYSIDDALMKRMPKVITDLVRQRMAFPMHIPQIFNTWLGGKYTDLEIVAWLYRNLKLETIEVYGEGHPDADINPVKEAQNWIDTHRQKYGDPKSNFHGRFHAVKRSNRTDRGTLLY